MIAFLTSKIGIYLAGGVAAILTAIGLYFKGKSKGKNEAFLNAARATAKLIIDAAEKRESTRGKFEKIRDDINLKHPDE